MKYIACILCALCGCTTVVPAQDFRERNRYTVNPMVHDPVMAQEGNTYYIYSTGMGLSVMSSTDLKTWRHEAPVFQQPPVWAVESIKGYKGHTWAPDLIYHNGNYHLFYSCSTFGKNTSAIGHAWRPTLNPADTVSWHDTGAVVMSVPGLPFNAIDPNVIVDEDGTPWMSFGSFWGGIQLVELTADMTATVKPERFHVICSRTNDTELNPAGVPVTNAVEAPFIYRHGAYYYLFVSFDFCCRGTKSNYKVMVGRSDKVSGPYLDKEGRDMAAGGGSLIIDRSADFVAIGHNAVCRIGDKDYFLAHGYSRKGNGASHLVLTEIMWDEAGWPIVRLDK